MTISRALRLMPAVVLVLGLTACTDDDPGSGKGTPASSAAGTTAGTSETTSTAPETPSVEPATGKELSVATVSMRQIGRAHV